MMSLARALWRKKYVFVILVLWYTTVSFFMQLLRTTSSNTNIYRRLHDNAFTTLWTELRNRMGKTPMIARYKPVYDLYKPPNGTHMAPPSARHKLFYNPHKPPRQFTKWLNKSVKRCWGNLTVYDNEFVHFRGIVLDRRYLTGRKGGEPIEDVIGQKEEVEYHKCTFGCFNIACDNIINLYFNYNDNHLRSWYAGLRTTNRLSQEVDATRRQFTIMIVRYEYANIYNSFLDFYNSFLLMNFFNRTQHDTNILIVDGHPWGQLDSIWGTLFNSSVRVSSLPTRTLFTDAVWGMTGDNNPLNRIIRDEIALLEEFREFFLSSYNISDNHKLDCRHLSVQFIWRHDYLAHPRNPTYAIDRKIKNEAQLLLFMKTEYPDFTIRGDQIDQFEFERQLKLVTNTDILIGMYGEALTHTVFLPKHATLIQLDPFEWPVNAYFQDIAKWRHMHFLSWESRVVSDDRNTYIPTDVLRGLVESAIRKMCGSDNEA